jgi:hypothetical protein
MRITFSPTRRDDRLVLIKSGDVLTINGEAFDFSALPEGNTLPRDAVACEWLAGDVERIEGVIHLALILPHGAQAPQQTRFPVPIIAGDGPVALPPYDADPQEDEA